MVVIGVGTCIDADKNSFTRADSKYLVFIFAADNDLKYT